MKRHRLWFAAIVLAAGLTASSCKDDKLFQFSKDFPAATWAYGDSAVFDFDIADTSKRYDLWLTVRHRRDYAFENLYVKFTTIFPGRQKLLKGKDRSEQVTSLTLARKDGSWYGSCSGERCAHDIPIQTRAWFPQPGRYRLVIHQYMRTDSLPGIEGLDFAVKYHREDKK